MSVEWLDALGRDLGSWVLGVGLWTAGLLAVVLLVDRFARRFVSPGGRMLLYAVVFARVLLPLDFASPLGLAPAIEQGTLVLPEVARTASTGAVATTAGAAAPNPSGLPWGLIVLFAYALGVIALGVRILVGHLRLRREVFAGGWRRGFPGGPDLIEHPTEGPLAIGGKVVIPARLFETLDDSDLDAVVRHERAHLRHGDPWLAGSLAAVCVLAWPILPLWLAARRVRLLMELRADAAAVDGHDRKAYRSLMLRIAAAGWQKASLSPAFGPVAALEARIAAIGSSGYWPAWAGGLATVLVGGVALCCAGHSEPSDKSAVDSEPVVAACPLPGFKDESAEGAEASARLRAKLAAAGSDAVGASDKARRIEKIAAEVFAEAQSLQLPWVAGEARLVYGQQLSARGAYAQAEQELEEAAWLGASIAYDSLAVAAAAETMVNALHAGNPGDAMAWRRHYEAAHKRSGSAPTMSEHRMLSALITHFEGTGETQDVPELRRRLAVVANACGVR